MIKLAGPLNDPSTSAKYALGTRTTPLANGNEYIYLKGGGSSGTITTYGVVTYDGDFKATGLVAGTYGPVAVSQGSAADGYYNWFLIKGVGSASVRETTTGGDQLFASAAGAGGQQFSTNKLTGSIVVGAWAGTTHASGSTQQVLLNYPSHGYSILA